MSTPKPIDHSIFAKPSTLARAAFADFERAEADPRVEINMGQWCKPLYPEDQTEESAPNVAPTCAVCFAGAVIIGALGCDAQSYDDEGYDALLELGLSDTEARQVHALDDLRTGSVAEYVYRWAGAADIDVDDLDETWSHSGHGWGSIPELQPLWKAKVLETIAALEARGL